MAFLIWLQDSAFSIWLRESDWAIFAVLISHTVGMAFVAGVGIVIALRILGVAAQVPLSLLSRFAPVMKIGLSTAILSGVLLVMSYPAKALTNPLFYIKLLVLVVAVLTTRALLAKGTSLAKKLALLSIALWVVAIAAGKFLAYTNTMLLVY
jgi:hypothetical protein